MEELADKVLIKIILINDIPYIWDAKEYGMLRTHYRICGALDGATVKRSPKGYLNQFLPARLSKFEAIYLVKHGIALAFQIPSLGDPRPNVAPERVQDLKSERRVKEIEAHRQKRRLQIEEIIDKIIEGKNKKLKGRGPVPDRETVIEEEMQKAVLPYETTQIDMVDPWIEDVDFIPCDIPMPDTSLDKLRFKVFEDFHLRRKYFISNGLKFGGDFLAYPGDPSHTHSEFIIVCHDTTRGPLPLHVGSLIRLANTVKKVLLIATLDEKNDRVKYKAMNKLHVPTKKIQSRKDVHLNKK